MMPDGENLLVAESDLADSLSPIWIERFQHAIQNLTTP